MKFGYIPDPAHRRTQKPFHKLLAHLQLALPPAASIAVDEASVMDQGSGDYGTGSCTGHGSAQAIVATLKANHEELPFVPSPRGIYDNARAKARRDANPGATLPPLTDDGAMPSDVAATLDSPGVRAIQSPTSDGRYSDCEPANINVEPTLSEIESESPVSAEHRIDEASADFTKQVQLAIVNKFAVGIGVFVDTAFMAYDGVNPVNAPPNFGDVNGGGHWLCITSYYTLPNGKVVFRGPNSWGNQWGSSGHFEVTENWLRVACSDCYVFTPRDIGAKSDSTPRSTSTCEVCSKAAGAPVADHEGYCHCGARLVNGQCSAPAVAAARQRQASRLARHAEAKRIAKEAADAEEAARAAAEEQHAAEIAAMEAETREDETFTADDPSGVSGVSDASDASTEPPADR